MYVSDATCLCYICWTDHIGSGAPCPTNNPKPFMGVLQQRVGSRGCVAGITSQPSSCSHTNARITLQPNLDYLQFHVLELNRYHRQHRCEVSADLSNRNCLSIRLIRDCWPITCCNR